MYRTISTSVSNVMNYKGMNDGRKQKKMSKKERISQKISVYFIAQIRMETQLVSKRNQYANAGNWALRMRTK